MASNRRHTEFFGPDLARGPNIAGNPEVSAIQIATTLAQVRAPVLRSDDALREHVLFIRELADQLMPDWAAQVTTDNSPMDIDRRITTTIRVANGGYTLLNLWLADGIGLGLTNTTTQTVTFDSATKIIREFEAKRYYQVLTPDTGVVIATVQSAFEDSFAWGIARQGRVRYSEVLSFPA